MLSLLLRQSQTKPSFLVALICAAVLATGTVVGLLLHWSALQVDQASAVRDEKILSSAVTRSAARIAKEQEASTVWNDAVLRVESPDSEWFDANLGVWMHSYYGHDETYVLNGRDEPIYAMIDGERALIESFSSVRPKAAELVHDLRRKLAAGEPADAADVQTPGVQDIAVVHGHPAIVSVKPIVPDTDAIFQAPGSEGVHISVRYLDGNFTDRLAANFQLQDARFSLENDRRIEQVALPYVARDGTVAGYLIWSPYLPGSSVRDRVGPALATALVGIAVIIGTLVLALREGASALKRSEARARHLAEHDPLTDLPNRMLFNERLEALLDRVSHRNTTLALLALDLDRFKQVNDSLGHPAGDELLRQVGARLCNAVRASDTVARIGGDEFSIILPNADDRLIETVCSRLLAVIQEDFDVLGHPVSIGLSVGVAVAPADAQDKDVLIRYADLALYAAKQRGRGRYVRFTKRLDQSSEVARPAATPARIFGIAASPKLSFKS